MNRRYFLKLFGLALAAFGLGQKHEATAKQPRKFGCVLIKKGQQSPTSLLTPTIIREAYMSTGRPLCSEGYIRVVTDNDTMEYMRARFSYAELKGICFSRVDYCRRFDVIDGVRHYLNPAYVRLEPSAGPFQDHLLMEGDTPVCVVSSPTCPLA